MDQRWRRRTVDELQLLPGMAVLDLASGTGDLAAEAVRRLVPLGRVVGCDLSLPMLVGAQRKFDTRALEPWHLSYTQGKGEALPFAGRSFNAASMGFALRNVSDLDLVFRELHRVVKPGGRVALLEFGRPGNPLLALGHRIWLLFAVPVIGALTTGKLWPFLYLRRSILQFMPPEEVVRRLSEAGFTDADSKRLTAGAIRLYTATR